MCQPVEHGSYKASIRYSIGRRIWSHKLSDVIGFFLQSIIWKCNFVFLVLHDKPIVDYKEHAALANQSYIGFGQT